jgi:PAS domain S-box-containing protein
MEKGSKEAENLPPGSGWRRVPTILGWGVAGLGLLALAGWFFGLEPFRRVPGLASMKTNTALCFVLAGAALALRDRRILRHVCAAIVCALAALSLAEYLTGADFGIDQILVRDPGDPYTIPGRMALFTTFAFLLGGAALALLRAARAWRWAQKALALGPGLIGLVSLLGYSYEARQLYGVAAPSSIAPTTAAVFILLAAGLIFARLDGLAAVLIASGPGRKLARRLLPAALLLPAVLGWIHVLGERAGFLTPQLGIGLLVLTVMLSFATLVWWAARALNRDALARQRAELAMEEAYARLRTLFDQRIGGIGIVIGNARGDILESNDYYLGTLGITREELRAGSARWIGMTPSEWLPADERAIAQLRDRGICDPYEKEYVRRDGTRVPVLIVKAMLPGGRDEILTFVMNIAERKQAEEALRQSERRFRDLAEALPQIVWTADAEGGVDWFNRRWYEYTGEPDSESESWPWEKSAHPDDIAPTLTNWAEARRAGSLFQNEFRLRRHDGQYRWFLVRAWPLQDGNGKVMRWFGSHTDIHDLKQAEAVVRANEERLERKNREIALANRILRVFVEETGDVLFDKALGIVREGLKSEQGVFGYIDENGDLVCPSMSKPLAECEVAGTCIRYQRAKWKGLWSRALLEKRVLFTNAPPRVPPGHVPISRNLAAPILFQHRVIGLLNLANKATDYTEEDGRILEGIAARVAPVLYAWIHKAMREEERKRTEGALRESEERLRRAQEIAHLGSWELDLGRNRLTWSDEVYRIFGFGPGEFEATYEAFLQSVHPDDRAAVDAAYSGSLREGRDRYEVEHRVIRRDTGDIRVVHEKCEHFRDESGRIVRSVGMVHDITERKRVEELGRALAEQERLRLGAAVEQAVEAVVMVEQDGTIRYVNSAFGTINRCPKEEALGKSYFDFVAADPFAKDIRNAVGRGEPWHGHLVRTPPGEKSLELEVAVSPVTDASGAILSSLVTERDVTQEVVLQQQVRQAQKMEALGTLAGGITHDFNNILSTIVINTELALLDAEEDDPARRTLPLVLRAADRGKELVKQIITFSRQREWERKPLKVSPIVKEAVKFLRTTLPKDIAIHESIAREADVVLADPSQVHQILMNLCQNAAHAMRENGGTLDIQMAAVDVDAAMAARHPDLKPGPYLRLTVGDTGKGIPKEVMDRIFDPFFTTKKQGEGSGLGLSVVQGVVKGYRGAITVTSEVGKGTVFNVFLPRIEGEAQPAPSANPTATAGRERILLVEDETMQLKSMARMLERLGYRVTPRANGQAAFTTFKKNPDGFDLVITDQTMPRMTGVELVKALTQIRPGVPIILCTGFSEKIDGETVGLSGIREFVMKPFSLAEISGLIRRALGKND